MKKLNITWKYPAAQTCCGQFAFNAGDWQSARLLMRHFFQVFNCEAPIICPSASCVLTIRRHYPLLVETQEDAAKLSRLQPMVFEFTEWLHQLLPLPFSLTWPGNILIHHSCSARQLEIFPKLKDSLRIINQLQLIELSPDHSCCGFGGLFSLKRPKLALTMGSAYLHAALHTDATALVSPDVGCLLHFQHLMDVEKISLPTYHLVEFISQAIRNH